MFENRFNVFLQSCEKTMPARDDHSNGSGNYYNDQAKKPLFDESFDLFNVTVENSPALLELVSDSQRPVKKANEIKTVQVLNLSLVSAPMVFVLCKNLPQDIIDIPNIKLQIVITKYVDKNIPMENHHRTLVGKAIMHHLLVNNFERK